ncbi:hypothetical protein [Paenibacillus glufosinatiresistens]|uniref:hypothetical protein n=1 Tax=Paenibacillus glufosinatiresistens TaxID=3070657 RepID=UPI00286E48C6|nr:hypothetical protein [Paenibacillus sp. YX.27]
MTEFVLFMVFSILEIYAMFALAFSVFKIDLYPFEMIFAGFIMGFFSYILRYDHGWVQVDIIVQYVLVFAFLWMLFKIHIFYAAVMTGFAYQAYTSIQTVFYFLMSKLGLLSVKFPSVSDLNTYILQVSTATVALLIAWYIRKKRIGFDFIPDKQTGKVEMETREVLLVSLNIPSFAIILLTVYIANFINTILVILPMVYVLIFYIYVHFSYKKDRLHENDSF